MKCKKCREDKPLDCFTEWETRGTWWCRDCRRIQRAQRPKRSEMTPKQLAGRRERDRRMYHLPGNAEAKREYAKEHHQRVRGTPEFLQKKREQRRARDARRKANPEEYREYRDKVNARKRAAYARKKEQASLTMSTKDLMKGIL